MEQEIEIWKDIKGYEGLYRISSLGRVYSLKRFRHLLLSDRGGYKRIRLLKKNVYKTFSVHRLVLEAFKENPFNKSEVNHINAIKSDNRLINLEWCTGIENVRHARKMGLYPKVVLTSDNLNKMLENVKVKVIDNDTKIVYNSITDAANALGYKKSTLVHYLLGSRKNKTSLSYL